MLDNKHINQIYEMTDNQAEKIKEIIINITRDIKYDFKKEASRIISKQKDPYLKEILDSYQTNSTIENKYNASDILTILEDIFDQLKLNEIEEYNYEEYHFDCQNCKNIISSDDFPNLTKQDFKYCPYCGKPLED